MAKVLGIDLGTTNSAVAVIEGRRTQVLENGEGSYTTPSVVAITPDSASPIVGQTAKEQAALNPKNTVHSVKRLMGRRFDEGVVKDAAERLSYTIVGDDQGVACVEMDGKIYPPQQISAMVLQKIKVDAEAKLGESITQAVITIPAYFNDSQRQATIDAGTIAGLEVLRTITEPVAGALAWGIDQRQEATIAVFDLGGGTFDITILEVSEEVFEAKAINGDTYLGGYDFDTAILDWLVDEFKYETGIDLKQAQYRSAIQSLSQHAEQAKIRLSNTDQVRISQGYIAADASGPLHLNKTLTRSQMEGMVIPLLDRLEGPCQGAMADAGVGPEDIDHVILVGGMTRMPAVRDKVRDIFGQEPTSPVNPDEAVAIGAAIQAGILSGEGGMEEFLLLDVTPFSVGCRLVNGRNDIIIPRGSTLPTVETKPYTTAFDNQTVVGTNVTQGESSVASENHNLGDYQIKGLPPQPAGGPRIEITYAIDINGILTAIAREMETGKEVTITVEGSCRLRESEVARMREELATFE